MSSEVSQQTQAQAAVMTQTADKFERVNEGLQNMLNNLMGELEGLRQTWQGAGGRSFEQVKVQWQEDQQKLNRALSETASAIRTSGQQYDASDSEAGNRVASTNRGINLPL
ncbi:WXG100 family type VII secretion target [Micromonospora sp. NPDC049559]|uniref:WXG100 family type VII secretion target n=1 Tax=Micromonospora sp. NPDC049559 TaxID=3155923 RepID=UPI00343DBCD5